MIFMHKLRLVLDQNTKKEDIEFYPPPFYCTKNMRSVSFNRPLPHAVTDDQYLTNHFRLEGQLGWPST